MEEVKEKIMFQYVMSYKAYRRKMIALRASISGIVTGGLLALCALSVMGGIFAALAAATIGTISILVSLHNEQTYTVYNNRIAIKKRNSYSRTVVMFDDIVSVDYKVAFYEKDLSTGTVTVRAKTAKGRIKKYRLLHVFDASAGVGYLRSVAAGKGSTDSENNG